MASLCLAACALDRAQGLDLDRWKGELEAASSKELPALLRRMGAAPIKSERYRRIVLSKAQVLPASLLSHGRRERLVVLQFTAEVTDEVAAEGVRSHLSRMVTIDRWIALQAVPQGFCVMAAWDEDRFLEQGNGGPADGMRDFAGPVTVTLLPLTHPTLDTIQATRHVENISRQQTVGVTRRFFDVFGHTIVPVLELFDFESSCSACDPGWSRRWSEITGSPRRWVVQRTKSCPTAVSPPSDCVLHSEVLTPFYQPAPVPHPLSSE